ncbi:MULTISPECIES: ATP-binding response regulator [Saccharibacillus]|uniref:ATP-binding response regulator n=1 Tax=Saccharibacillus TaxID=456492 RepID=UPI00123BFEDB|nr:ATP-binding protein [Saccharibacillus sp. WB 17]MWJ33010.1 hypothetical protein [Saccharibacillus sp. WB 17]
MKDSMQAAACPSPALTAAAGDLLQLAAEVSGAETLFVAKRTENGIRTLFVWGRAREGLRVGELLNLPDPSGGESGLTVALPLLNGNEHGLLGARRSGRAFDAGEEQALGRAASVLARLAESEEKSSAVRREQELRQSREDAERAARQTGELLAMMGHDIRTPMNGIVAMSELLKESGLTTEQQQYLQIIEGSQQSLLELVGSILDYGKLEARQMKLEPAPMDLLGALEDTVYQFAAKAAQRPELELTLDLDLDPGLILIGDVGKIRQVVSNLLSNAIKFTAAGEVRISARRLDGQEGGDARAWIEIVVCDTGIGLSEADIGRLFQDYAQVHRDEAGDYGGTGLGLSISRRLVELMGGRIRAEGREGVGTRMIFAVPLEIDREVEPGVSDPAQLRDRRLLLAARGSGTRLTLSRLAARLGMEVRTASTVAEAALVLVGEGPFDLVLSEWALEEDPGPRPDLPSGAAPAAPLILLHPLIHDSEPALHEGRPAPASLTKPVRRSELCSVLALACCPAEG